MAIDEGMTLGRYEIRSHLGTGGMGEVYLAHDTHLERTVALKILPAEIAADRERMQRFIQEAKTASSLNHPNIITIHEIGQEESLYYIATEFIDGETLRERIARQGSLNLGESLDVATQVAAALAAAHDAGIVHRDIKPENIMIRRDRYVKVLDFGLAKPTERKSAGVDTEAATRMMVNTSPGMVMGTVSYMSPEQTRGYQLDARTDIWSLGVVLYEMLAGQTPFKGDTTSDVIVSVLDREPAPVFDFLPGAPPDLQRIIRKTLRKDREERYQTIKDLLVDLRALKQELDFSEQLERSGSPEARASLGFRTSGDYPSARTGGAQHVTTDEELLAHTIRVAHARTTDRSVLAAGEPWWKSRKRLLLPIALVVVLLPIIALSIFFLFFRHNGRPLAQQFQAMQITRLTSAGNATAAAISPDGKYVAHVVINAGQQSIWVMQVATSSLVQIVQPEDVAFSGPVFSRDGNYVYFLRHEKNKLVGELFQVPTLGGPAKKILTDIDSPMTLSPDGTQFAFVREDPNDLEAVIFIANADGTNERRLAARKGSAYFGDLTWSPDGQTIACSAGDTDAGGAYMNVIGVSVADGAEKSFTNERWLLVEGLTWLHDGTGLILSATDRATNLGQIWQLSYPDGHAQRITNDLNKYEGVSLTADSGALVTLQYEQLSNIWVAPAGRSISQAQQITSGTGRYYSFSWTPDGRIVYTSRSAGNRDIWIMDADGSHQRQLTNDAASDYQPSATPDGRYIFFISDRSGAPNIWRMDASGANQRQMTRGNNEGALHCSPAGDWIVYTSWNTGNPALWKIPVEGGEPVQVTNKFAMRPAVSPDGKYIACFYWDQQLASPVRLVVLDFATGEIVKTFDAPSGLARWTQDGRGLAYLDERGGVANVWLQPIDGGRPTQMTDFKLDRIFWFDWTFDGRQFAVARGTLTSDVVLISNFR
ncbi:MAG TPA: protein kinase [Pyrinomonadaceae bacterium]|nr:protein kinase [Pyrinomonadaceae bacterium]